MREETYTKGVDRTRGAYLDYGTRTVPDDGFNHLAIGYGWRKHWTILCPDCLTPSPYVIGMKDVADAIERDDGYVHDEWTLECPKCRLRFTWEDEYYED